MLHSIVVLLNFSSVRASVCKQVKRILHVQGHLHLITAISGVW